MKFRMSMIITATFLSGAAGLGYELVWSRMFAAGLGSETPSVLAVLAAFFGGTALGAWVLDRRISSSLHPERWYMVLEGVICCWAAVLSALLPEAGRMTSVMIGAEPTPMRQWFFSFAVPFFTLLPATFAMGGTLIAVERILASLRAKVSVAAVYAINTFGAVVGAATATFIVFPALGFSRSLLVFAGGSAVCAVGGLLSGQSRNNENGTLPEEVSPVSGPAPGVNIYAALFLTGLLGIGYEVLMVRTLSQILENTVYSFTAILIVYLVGTAFGAWLRERRNRVPDTFVVLLLLSGAVFTGTLMLRLTRLVFYMAGSMVHGSLPAMIGVEMLVAFIVLFFPAAAMGFTFSHLSLTVRGTAGGFGRAIALNTVGGMVAPILFGVVLLPALGLKTAFIMVVCAYCAVAFLPGPGRMTRRRMVTGILVTLLLFITGHFLTPGAALFTAVSPSDRILSSVDGIMATCTAVEDSRGGRHLLLNSRFNEGGTTTPLVDGREAAIPVLLHPSPRSALFLGVGAGITCSIARRFDSLQSESVELVPELKKLLPYFVGDDAAASLPVRYADARRFAAAAEKKYDVVDADQYNHEIDGAGLIYTTEHFRAIENLLDSTGLFCQWLPLYQMNGATLRTITRTFVSVFPHTAVCMAYYSLEQPVVGLVGLRQPLVLDSQRVESYRGNARMHQLLESLRFYSTTSLAGCVLGTDDAVKAFAGEGPLNTDDFPRVMFDAPSFAYGKGYQAPDSVMSELLSGFPSGSTAIVVTEDMSENGTFAAGVDRYGRARNRFLRMGIGALRASMRHGMEMHIDSLMACVRMCPDFEAAYNPLIGIAMSIAEDNVEKAEWILDELILLNPKRTEAAEVKKML